MPRGVATLLGMTLGAQLAVAPVLLTSFGTIEWVSIPANMLAVPLAALGAGVAFLASAVALVHVGAASGLFLLGAPSAAGVLGVARAGERFTGGLVLPESGVVRVAVVIGLGVVVATVRWLVTIAPRRQDATSLPDTIAEPAPTHARAGQAPGSASNASANSQNAV
jgi:competence protein ComEC